MNDVPPQSNRGIGWVRFIVWMMPSWVVGLVVYVSIRFPWPAVIGISMLLGFIALGFLAYFDALLSCHQRRTPRDVPDANIGEHVTNYLLLQALIVPFFWFGVGSALLVIVKLAFW